MQFTRRRKRSAPTIIIISLIDILIVLLIFLMVSTTFKQHPAVKLALPQSKQATTGSAENVMVVTIAPEQPFFYLDARPVTFEKLQGEMRERARLNPSLGVALRADSNAPFGQIIRVMDAVKAANLKTEVSAFTKNAAP